MDKILFIKQNLKLNDLLRILAIYPNKSGFIKSIYKEEKTPSLKIYPESDSYFCFATSQGGDIIKFYSDFYNLPIDKSIDDLYNLAGGGRNIQVHSRKIPDAASKQKEKKIKKCLTKDELYAYEEIAAITNEKNAFREIQLLRLNNNKKIFMNLYEYCRKYSKADSFRKYLYDKRCLDDGAIEKFKLFYIENYFEVNNHLKKSFPMSELKASGIVNENGNLIFAKHRLIIPYQHNGEIVYLRARFFEDGNPTTVGVKYIGLKNDALNVNTAKRLFNSDVFDKMVPSDQLYIVEGEFDAILLDNSDLFSVAIPGASNIPADKWFRKMKSYRINIMVDNDEAGKKLKERLIEKFKEHSISFDEIIIDGFKDITDYCLMKKYFGK